MRNVDISQLPFNARSDGDRLVGCRDCHCLLKHNDPWRVTRDV